MENIRRYKLFESLNKMSDSDRDIFERISKHNDSWIKSFKKSISNGKIERFADHFRIESLIMGLPDEMAAILLPLLEDVKFREWLKSVESDLPDSFKESFGLASDMKNLGF